VLEVQTEGVVEGHLMAVTSKDKEEFADD